MNSQNIYYVRLDRQKGFFDHYLEEVSKIDGFSVSIAQLFLKGEKAYWVRAHQLKRLLEIIPSDKLIFKYTSNIDGRVFELNQLAPEDDIAILVKSKNDYQKAYDWYKGLRPEEKKYTELMLEILQKIENGESVQELLDK